MALAKWHFGGGQQYCERCKQGGLECASGKLGHDGKRCPYIENAPQTGDGAQAWHLVQRGQGQLRMGGMGGVIGFDLPAILVLADAYGCDREAIAVLLPFAEAGMVQAINRRGDAGEPLE